MFLYQLAIVSAFIVGRTARDTLFLSRHDLKQLPLMYVGVAVAVSLSSLAYARISERWRRDVGILAFLVGAAALMIGAFALLATNVAGPWFYPVLYLLVEIMGAISMIQFWTFANEIFAAREAKRLFAIIGAGGVVASVLCGFTIASAAKRIGAEPLVLVVALLLLFGAYVVRAIAKSVGRPADIYSLGSVFYYLVSGAYANPKNLYDAFRKFVEYERKDETNTIAAYVEHEYRTIQNMRTPKQEGQSAPDLALEDRFFSYKHYLDGNGELIDPTILIIIAKAMVRNKPDSYCASWDLRTTGISQMVHDLFSLYVHFGVDPSARLAYQNENYAAPKKPSGMRRAWDRLFRK